MDDQNLPITDVSVSTVVYFKKHPGPMIACLTAAVLLMIGGVVLCAATQNGNYVALIFLPWIIPCAYYANVKGRIQDDFMRQFATANGYSFTIFGGDYGILDGILFHLGNSDRSLRDIVSGSYLNCPISLFNYEFATGSGKQRRVHYYTVFELQFDTSMPDLLLERKSAFSSDSLLGHLPEQIKLEGDFNNYFTLSIKKGYEVEALEIFTPDIMALLEEKCKDLSLEIVNNHLFIYDNKIVNTKIELDALYAVAQYFVQTLGPVLARMKGLATAMQATQNAAQIP